MKGQSKSPSYCIYEKPMYPYIEIFVSSTKDNQRSHYEYYDYYNKGSFGTRLICTKNRLLGNMRNILQKLMNIFQ